MPRPIGFMMIGFCCALSLTATACRGGTPEVDTAVDTAAPSDPNLPQDIAPVPEAAAPPTATPAPDPSPAATPAPTTPSPQGLVGTTLNPPQKAQLIAAQPEAQINLRSQPSTDSRSKGYGLVGDPVQLLRSAQGSDGREWYYVKFEQSGAEGWVRSDFINTAGRATPLPQRAAQGSECTGLLEALAFTAFYDASGFNLIRFTNLETKSTFDTPLSPQGGNPPTYSGSASPPTGGTFPVQLTDQSGGNPGGGSQVTLNYAGMTATGTCQ